MIRYIDEAATLEYGKVFVQVSCLGREQSVEIHTLCLMRMDQRTITLLYLERSALLKIRCCTLVICVLQAVDVPAPYGGLCFISSIRKKTPSK
ncbi:hypothetical protein C5167_050024 [Papaver somniferum]|uniref:Uncharacterized protein n=1 Tax=Papaver somniferum TaxID=3469 RepID=A0A4Y7KMG3_PAPSO|nr:hypothetical protein C5167_050024 [Papaver somniferum]